MHWLLIAWFGLIGAIYAGIIVRRYSERGLPKRKPKPRYVAPLTRTEQLALAKRDYFEQMAESEQMGLDRESLEAVQQQIYQRFLQKIDRYFQ